MEWYYVAKKKSIRNERTKLQTAMEISLWFLSFFACPELYNLWLVNTLTNLSESNQGVHGFFFLLAQ